LKVLFTTGYARNAIFITVASDKGVQLIVKPFSFTELSAKIRDVLAICTGAPGHRVDFHKHFHAEVIALLCSA
jgi:DNA-binding response OmpR family regulator